MSEKDTDAHVSDAEAERMLDAALGGLTPHEALLEASLAKYDGVILADELMAIGVPAAPVLNVEQALEAPHTQHSEMVVQMGEYRGLGAPVKLSRTPATYRHAPLSEGKEFLPREDR